MVEAVYLRNYMPLDVLRWSDERLKITWTEYNVSVGIFFIWKLKVQSSIRRIRTVGVQWSVHTHIEQVSV